MTLPLDVQPDLQGIQQPRISSVPTFTSSAGAEAIEVAELAGLFLDPWQKLVITSSLGERPDGKWAAPDVGLVVSRQNGKGSALAARELAGLFLLGEEVIIHSAHEQATASEQFRRLVSLIEGVPEFDRRILKVVRGKGSEAIELRGGQRVFFKTRTSGGGRGFTADCLIYDEAMILPDAFVAAVSPTLAARSLLTRTGVQTWYTGSAVDEEKNEHGISFARIRERGLAGDQTVAYFEWSCEGDDPGRVANEVLTDPNNWAQANPALGIRIASEYVEREVRQLGPRGFAVERLSIGAWPKPDAEAHRVVTVQAWQALVNEGSKMASKDGVLAFDVAPDLSMGAIAGAGYTDDGKVHVGIIDRDQRFSWIAPRLAELYRLLHPSLIICDAGSQAISVMPELERLGVPVKVTSSKEYAQACSLFAEAVQNQTISHLGDPSLLTAVDGADTKPLSDSWKWDRRKSGAADISPLVAATLAHWGVVTQSHGEMVWSVAEVIRNMQAREAVMQVDEQVSDSPIIQPESLQLDEDDAPSTLSEWWEKYGAIEGS